MGQQKVKIAVNGYVLIGKRIADAVSLQDDMELVGVSDVISDWRIKAALERGFHVFSADQDSGKKMKAGGISVSGDLDELLSEINVVWGGQTHQYDADEAEKLC